MTSPLQTRLLPAIVFFTGAITLVVEVVATRILSPYFGNTVFTVSSVIGVVLAALSCGYFYGGRLADRRPQAHVFYALILFSGVGVLMIYGLMLSFLPAVQDKFSITTGPLIVSLALFFIPSVLLGTLSPFAIRLQTAASPKEGAGSIAGGIFFWSTLGSIAGSLLSGFVLIPLFGIKAIILTAGLSLALLGSALLAASPGLKKKFLKTLFGWLTFCLVLLAVAVRKEVPLPTALYRHDGVYERVTIYDGEKDGHPARYLMQDRSESGSMYLDSDELSAPYTRYALLYKAFMPQAKNALLVGGGAWSVPKALLKDLPPDAHIDVAEIEPSLPELTKKYFKVPDDPRLNSMIVDGRRALQAADKKYDLIFSDVYFSLYSTPAHFTTTEFFRSAKGKMSNGGLFVANLVGSLTRAQPSFLFSEINTFREVFPNSYFFAVVSPATPDVQNIMAVGYNSDKKMDFTAPEIKKSSNAVISHLQDHLIDLGRFDMAAYPVLTDDHAPVEYMMSTALERGFAKNKKPLDGDEMMNLIAQQLRAGSRVPGTPGHDKVRDFLAAEMRAYTPDVTVQSWNQPSETGMPLRLSNIVARFYPEKQNRVILGTHYDSWRLGPDANGSASGVAVMSEVARLLSVVTNPPEIGVDVVFFDGEEDTRPPTGADWQPMGSAWFADHLDQFYKTKKPQSGLMVDLVCDKNLLIDQDGASLQHAPLQTGLVWAVASQLYPNNFSMESTTDTVDDHTALNDAGIPSVLLIDSAYPPYRTAQDTLDKCSGDSMEVVGNTVIQYLYNLH